MANASPNRALAQKALAEAEAAIKAAEAAVSTDAAPAPSTSAAPAVAPKAAQAVHQKSTKPRRSLGHTADLSNLKSSVAAKLSASLNVVAQYVNAASGTPAEVARQKFNELVAAINSTAS